jgi:hypothetical protein
MGTILKRTAPEGSHSKEGKTSKGDAWMHPEVFDDEYEKHTTREIKRLRHTEKSLVINLVKADSPKTGRTLNRAKLVRRPVQVKGKDGRVFTRMQWVDPNDERIMPKAKKQEPFHPESHPLHEKFGTKPVSRKHPDDMNREEFIDYHVRKKMTREQQYDMIDKHGIDWKRNEHPNIDHKNAIVALKNHLKDNPHLIGAEHKPLAEEVKKKNPVGTDDVNEYWNMWTKKGREESYDLLRKLGIIGKDDKDPMEGIDPNDTKAKQLAGMKHLLAVTKLKKYLQDNPHIMRDPDYLPDTNAGREEAKKIERENKKIKPSAAQKGGNDIDGILKGMTSEKLYKLMKQQGIADGDPRLEPNKGNAGALAHYRNMILLKKKIEQDPSILNKDEHGRISKEEKERIASLPAEEKEKERIQAFVKDMNEEDVSDAYEILEGKYPEEIEDYGESLLNNKHHGIRNMHRKTFIQKMFKKHPEHMNDFKDSVETTRLMRVNMGNKLMRKFLTSVIGLKGIGDVTRPKDEELRDIQWNFRGEESSVRKEINHEGVPVLSVIDVGENLDRFDEWEVPLSEVKDWLESLKKKVDKQIEKQEKPLHLQSIDKIEQALEEDFDGNYNEDVGKAMQKQIAKAWKVGGRSGTLSSIAKQMNKSTLPTVKKLFDKWGIDIDSSQIMSTFNPFSDEWKKLAFQDDIESTKGKNAWEYMEAGKIGNTHDPYVLIESAKNWSPQEIHVARKELNERAIQVDNHIHREDHNHRMRQLQEHFHHGMSHIPFDIFSHLHARGLKLSISETNSLGSKHSGASFSPKDFTCRFDTAYYHDKSIFESHPMRHKPASTDHPVIPNAKIGHWDMQDSIAHETAHAVDAMLSVRGAGVKWDNDRIVKQLIPKEHRDLIPRSYREKVSATNPDHEIGRTSARLGNYPYVKDQWFTNYEGRLYGALYEKADPTFVDNYKGKLYDKAFLNGQAGDHGSEHWTESVTAYANAKHAFDLWKQKNPEHKNDYKSVDEWAESAFHKAREANYGMDYEAESNPKLRSWGQLKGSNPIMHAGWKYHALRTNSPTMFNGLKGILDRGDFANHKE